MSLMPTIRARSIIYRVKQRGNAVYLLRAGAILRLEGHNLAIGAGMHLIGTAPVFVVGQHSKASRGRHAVVIVAPLRCA